MLNFFSGRGVKKSSGNNEDDNQSKKIRVEYCTYPKMDEYCATNYMPNISDVEKASAKTALEMAQGDLNFLDAKDLYMKTRILNKVAKETHYKPV